jgi:UDP-N-acetylglucosamine:LPS N-acetylglucosamine transferase
MSRIALIASPGGHLAEVMAIGWDLMAEHDCFLVVTRFPAVREIRLENFPRVHYAPMLFKYQQPFGVILSMIAGLWTFFRIFLKERPDVVISTGAEVAWPAFLINRLFFRRKALFVESLARTDAPSLSGRLCYRLADRVLVQWPGVLDHYGPKAQFRGRVI